MKITVGELFEFAVEMDMSLVAHSIYWALTNGKVDANDNMEKLKKVQSDEAEILRLHKTNLLGTGRNKLYAVKTQTKDWFAFYFAEQALDVFRLHREKFRETNVHLLPADRLLCGVMASAETGKEEFLFERKKRMAEFPAYVGHARAGELVMFRVG